LGAYGFI
jgi:hypothetical protein